MHRALFFAFALVGIVSSVWAAVPDVQSNALGGSTTNALGGSPAAIGGTVLPSKTPLEAALELAFLRYDAEESPGTDDTQSTEWVNIGSAGSSWDAGTAVSGGLTWQQAGDCTWGSKPCFVTDALGANALKMATAQSEAWTSAQYHCFVGHTPGTGIVRVVDVCQTGNASRNMWGSNGASDFFYIADSTATSALADRDAQLIAMCVDMTDPTAATHAVNGGSISTSNISGALFKDIEQISLGSRFDGALPCANCEIHTYVAWNVDPGHDVQALSQFLYDYWSE